jgi:hypothetical protein
MVDKAPLSAYNAMHPYAVSLGVPDALWEYLAHYETGGFPSAIYCPAQGKIVDYTHWIGDGPQYGGYSYGMFQMHVGDGVLYATTNGQGNTALQQLTGHPRPWSPAERALLLDNNVQARYGMPPIASAWNKYKNTFDNSYNWWIKFLAESGHPGGSASDPITQMYARNFIPLYNTGRYGVLQRGQGASPGPSAGVSTLPVLAQNFDFSWITRSQDISLTYQDHWARDVQETQSRPLTSPVSGTVIDLNQSGNAGGGIGCQIYVIPDAYPQGVGPIKADWKPSDGGFGTLQVRNYMSAGVVPGPKYGRLVWYSYHFLPGTAVVKNGDRVLAGQKLAMTGYYGHAGVFNHAHTGWFYNWATKTIHGTYPFGPDILPALLQIQKNGKPSLVGGTGGEASSTPTADTGTSSGGGQTYTTLLTQVHATLVSNPGFLGIAKTLDEAEQFPGFINLTDDYHAGPFTMPDPVGIVRSIGATVTDNFVPFIFRSGVVCAGLLLLGLLAYKAVIDSGAGQLVAPAVEAGMV